MTDQDFNPADKAIKIQGGALYLQVKDRLIWARKEHPLLRVQTEMLRLDEKIAVFKAHVGYVGDHVEVCGEGHGSESPNHFPDYIEKAETKAIGRALAALGYGTAAAFEEDPSRIADAPVQRAQPNSDRTQIQTSRQAQPPARASTSTTGGNAPPDPLRLPGGATQRQAKYMWELARERYPTPQEAGEGIDNASITIHQEIDRRYRKQSVNDLTTFEMSALIDWLKAPPQSAPAGTFMGAEVEEPARTRDVRDYGA